MDTLMNKISSLENGSGTTSSNIKNVLSTSSYNKNYDLNINSDNFGEAQDRHEFQEDNFDKGINKKINFNLEKDYDKNKNISADNKNSNYEYLSEFNLNELIYILIKNFEANKFDVNIIEERVLKDANNNELINLLPNNTKEFTHKLTNNILNLLKV
jgi:hypothetical protein